MCKYEVESTFLKTKFGEFEFFCFSWGKHEEDNILVLRNKDVKNVPLVRVQSACYTAEIFRSLDCDCHAQLNESQKLIASEGGYLIYMLCDGRGAGLLNKFRGLELGRKMGMDTSDAYSHLNLEQDPREYSRVVEILNYFSLLDLRLLTNNPRKITSIESSGISVIREPLEIQSNEYSKPYLKTKALKMGHLLNEFRG